MLKLAIVHQHWKNAIYKILWPKAATAAVAVAAFIMQFPFASTHMRKNEKYAVKVKLAKDKNTEHKYL